MSEESTAFTKWFNLWPSIVTLAEDMNVPTPRAYQWVKRGYVDPFYWHELRAALARRFGLIVEMEDMVNASKERGEIRLAAMQKRVKKRKNRRENDKGTTIAEDSGDARTEAA